MGNLKSSSPTSPDVEGMFEDAAYWNRYNQTTPWGGIRWNEDRTAMEQYLSPEMQQLMGMQMGMYGGALAEMMSWFGMDPSAFASFGMNPEFPGYSGEGDLPPDWYYDPETGEWYPDVNLDPTQESKSLTAPEFDDAEGWQELFGQWGMPQFGPNQGPEDENWTGSVPTWFSETRHGNDPAAYAAWYAMERLDIDPSVFFGEEGRQPGWGSDDFQSDWQSQLNNALGLLTPRRPTGRYDDDDGTPADDLPPYTPPGGGMPWGTGETGGPFSNWGGREPEMFFAENIPELLWELDWDAIPDLPTMDQFTEDRERLTQEMYTQGLGLLDPYLQEQESVRRQGLSDRGIPISAEIGMAEMGDFGRERARHLGDLTFASTMGGYDEAARQFGLGLGAYQTGLQGELSRLGAANQARSQAWNERMGVRSQKWNELASILGMSMAPSQQMGYNFNPNIDTMSGYGMEYQNNQYNAGLFQQYFSDILGAISFM